MKVVLLASNGGSGGLKGYIKGFVSACGERPDWEWFVICDHTFAEYIKETCINSNVTLIVKDYSMGVKSIIKGNCLPDDVIQVIDQICPDVVFHMNSIIHKGTEKYKNVVGLHNQLYIDKKQLRRQGIGKSRFVISVLRHFAIKSIKEADLVVFDSKASLEQTKSCGVYPRNSVVAYFGVEESERKTEWETKALSNPINLLYISTLYPYKNQVELIKGVSRLIQMDYNVHLDLVGSGMQKYAKAIKRVIEKNDLNSAVTIHNWVDHKKIKDMIDACDVFVYASSIETSGFGLMEGMVRGAVIACNQESCMPEILNGSGAVFNVSSPKDVADKLKMVIEDASARESMSKRAFEVSKQYTWENCIKVIADAITQLQ